MSEVKESLSEVEEEPSQAEVFAGILQGTATGMYAAAVLPLTARIPIEYMAWLDVMAGKAGTSRTYILVQVLKVALETMEGELDARTSAALRKAHANKVRELIKSVEVTAEREQC